MSTMIRLTAVLAEKRLEGVLMRMRLEGVLMRMRLERVLIRMRLERVLIRWRNESLDWQRFAMERIVCAKIVVQPNVPWERIRTH